MFPNHEDRGLLDMTIMRRMLSSLGLGLCLLAADPDLLLATSAISQSLPAQTQVPDSSQSGGTGLDKIISPSIEESPLGSEGPDALARALRNAIASQPEVP